MAFDYTKLKTPFFKIKIGDSKGEPKKLVNLPHHILRLVSNIEIVETFEQNQYNSISITFVEGSREPASPDASLGEKGLYKISNNVDGSGGADMDVAGSLSNRVGIIADLRFSGDRGITFLSEKEKRQNAIDTTLQKNVNNKNTSRSYPREESKPQLLFQEKNQVVVTWGYKEAPELTRTIRARIFNISVKYPESGQVETTIMCYDTNAALDQLALNKGLPFGTKITTEAGNTITKIQDSDISKLVKDLADKTGTPSIISENLPFPVLDNEQQKIWLAGESFTQFMQRLASLTRSVFKVIPNPETGIDTLYFIKEKDFASKVLVGRDLLTYKAPNSILKQVEINVDFAALQGETKLAVDEKGEELATKEQHGATQKPLFESNKRLPDNSPVSNFNPIPIAQGLVNLSLDSSLQDRPSPNTPVDYTQYVCSSAEITPVENQELVKNSAEVDASYKSDRIINLNFTTIGYPKLVPGTVDIGGIGVRYSGKYRVLTVNHKINSSGYITECKALSTAFTSGGVLDPLADIIPDKPVQKSDSQLFEKSNSIIRDKFDKSYGT